MKKTIGLLLGVLLTLVSAVSLAGCGSGINYPNVKGKFTVATNCPFGMYEYIGDDGKIYGIDIEVAGLFAKEEGLVSW